MPIVVAASGMELHRRSGGVRPGGIGSTDPDGESREPEHPVRVEDLHATIQAALGIDPEKELVIPVGRPLALTDGVEIRRLLKI